MLDATLATMGWVVSNHLNAGVDPRPMGNENVTAAPSGTFATGAGLVNIAANEQKQFETLCAELGAPELARDPRYAGRESRKTHRATLKAAIEARLAHDTATCMGGAPGGARGPRRRGAVGARRSSRTSMCARARSSRPTTTCRADAHPVAVAATGLRVDGSRRAASRPPTLSEHRDALLAELGYAPDERAALVEAGAVALIGGVSASAVCPAAAVRGIVAGNACERPMPPGVRRLRCTRIPGGLPCVSPRPALAALVATAALAIALPAQAIDPLKMMIPANPGGGWDQTGARAAAAMQTTKLVARRAGRQQRRRRRHDRPRAVRQPAPRAIRTR